MATKKKTKRTSVTNVEIAQMLQDVGDLLEIKGDNPFKIRAYSNAALTVRRQAEPLEGMVEDEEDLSELSGIGKDIAGYIEEIVKTGRLKRLKDLEKDVPRSLLEVVRLPGVGAKRAKRLWKELDVDSLADLERAAKKGKIAELEGFGEKSQKNILDGIADQKKHKGRHLLGDADQYVEPLVEYMKKCKQLKKIEVAGSYRRRKETVGDIDILVMADNGREVMDHFCEFGQVKKVVQRGETRGTVMLGVGLQVDLRIVPERSFGAALVYFTGSKAHNITLRKRAQKRKLRISEYGVFKTDTKKKDVPKSGPWAGEQIGGKTEEDVYECIDLAWIPPELREDRGEIDAAEEGDLPKLIELKDIRGDLQMHSTWSDGKDTLQAMYEACMERDYEYMAITDHSKALAMTKGLDKAKLKRQFKEIEKITKGRRKTKLLKSMEVDIHDDGSLDLEDDMLKQLDVVVVSVHSKFNLSSKDQTKRIVTALQHPEVNIFAHPTGRLLNRREPYQFDWEDVLKCAADNNVALEINSQPDRLDLNDAAAISAKEHGVKIVISTDAHRTAELDFIRYGVDQARRAWLTKSDVINTKPLKSFLKAMDK